MGPVPRPGVGSLTPPQAGGKTARIQPVPAYDAVVLAGGRASRLGGYPKPQLAYRGATLLEHALAAVAAARSVAVVGPAPGEPGGPPGSGASGAGEPGRVLFTREEPLYTGPVAALSAGLEALHPGHGGAPGWIAVVAADLPRPADAVAALLEAASAEPDCDGILGEDADGRTQPLLSLLRRDPLVRALDALARDGGLANRPMKHVIARLGLLPLRLPPGSSADVDTWDAARRWGIEGPDVPGRAPRQEDAHE
ncbi:nucleotidyltransferase family protein [Sinomonas sp. RB5]